MLNIDEYFETTYKKDTTINANKIQRSFKTLFLDTYRKSLKDMYNILNPNRKYSSKELYSLFSDLDLYTILKYIPEGLYDKTLK